MTVPPLFSACFAGAVVRHLTDQTLTAGLPAHLAGDKVPPHVVFPNIPKTSTGNIHTIKIKRDGEGGVRGLPRETLAAISPPSAA